MRALLAAALALALGGAAMAAAPRAVAQDTTQPASPPAATAMASSAVIRGLDKVSGATMDWTLSNGDSARLGRLTITAGECRYPADDPASNAFVWLVIRDDLASAPVFEGWMIAAAPALNALDHSRYDVWPIRCTTSDG